jgi:hypothetical protein
MPECKRFVRGLVAWLGFRQIGIPYQQAQRHAGVPAYSRWHRTRLRACIKTSEVGSSHRSLHNRT